MSRPRPPVFAALFAGALFASPALGQNPVWVAFTDQTSTRLAAAPGVGVSDPEEKDICVGDVDNDGDTDVVVVRKYPFTVPGPRRDVLFINDNGILTDMTATLAPGLLALSDARAAELVDFDVNGWLDLVIATTFGDPPKIYMNWGNNASGQWAGLVNESWRCPPLPPQGLTSSPRFCGLGVGDFSGDGKPDIYFVDYLNTLEDRIWLNNGSGVFTDVTATNLSGSLAASGFGTAGWIVDMDGDGDRDLVKSENGPITIIWNNGAGVFTSSTSPSADSGYDVGVGDLDNDGDLDMYFCQDPQDQYKINPGGIASHTAGAWFGHQFSTAESAFTGGFNANPHFADVDGDGDLDVGVSDVDVDIPGFSRRFSLLRNNYPQTSPSLLSSPYGSIGQNFNLFGTYDHAFLDVNGDGWKDLWIAYGTSSSSGGTKIFIQRPRARLTVLGTGCAGTSGIPAIGGNGLPTLTNPSFAVTLSNAAPSTVALHFLTIFSTSLPFGPCTVYADLFNSTLFSSAVITSPTGAASFPLPIPSGMAFEGVTMYEQWVVLDPLGALQVGGLGIAMTAGLKIEVGI